MAEAVFLVDIRAEKAVVHHALTSQAGVEGWWTDDAKVSSTELDLGFPDAPARFSMPVVAVTESSVTWSSAGEFPPHWVGTEVAWQLNDHPSGSGTQVFFSHSGFAAPDPMLGHTAYTWALLFDHLRRYCETGISDPFFAS